MGQSRVNQGAKGPQGRAKPGIKSVGVLLPFVPAVRLIGWWLDADVGLLATVGISAVPGRNPVPPPNLAANAPIAVVIDPVAVNFVKALGNNLYVFVGNDCLQNLGDAAALPFPLDNRLVDVDKPLQTNLWLNDGFTPLVDSNTVQVIVVGFDQ